MANHELISAFLQWIDILSPCIVFMVFPSVIIAVDSFIPRSPQICLVDGRYLAKHLHLRQGSAFRVKRFGNS